MVMMKLVIKRSKWLRGDNDSYLERPSDGKMCCLGFLALKLGYMHSDLCGNICPNDLPVDRMTYDLVKDDGKNTRTCNTLMSINDRVNIEETKREARLKEVFKRINIRAQFID